MIKDNLGVEHKLKSRRIRALVDAVRKRPDFMDKKLERIKKAAHKRAAASDFVWKEILKSFSTWGGVRGMDNFDRRYKSVRYNNLKGLQPSERRARLKEAFWDVWGRFRKVKLSHAVTNLKLIDALKGGAAASRKARSLRGDDAKKTFMKEFAGIGEKYARNIWMDVYDVDFRNSIAVDQRIENILKALGLQAAGMSKPEGEVFLRSIASQAGLDGWHLDRLLFNFTEYFIWAIEEVD